MSDTVKVRIAVGVGPSGDWNAVGSCSLESHDAMALAVDCVDAGEARYWVEAELPVPKATTVQGNVSHHTPEDEGNE